jgi:hypothetical protein
LTALGVQGSEKQNQSKIRFYCRFAGIVPGLFIELSEALYFYKLGNLSRIFMARQPPIHAMLTEPPYSSFVVDRHPDTQVG